MLSYKYRIYPNVIQREALDLIFGFCRNLYNCALEERISYYRKYGKSLSYNTQAKELLEIKDVCSEAANVYSQTLQQTLKQLDAAFVNFFRRIKNKNSNDKPGFPRFKNKDRFRSILFPQCDLINGGAKRLENNKIKVFKIPGEIKVIWHRPYQGRCKQVRIVRQNEKYYIVLTCEDVPKEHRTPTGKTVGIDLGIENFITMDDGTQLHHPKPYKTAKEKLKYLQQRRAAKQLGSNNDKKIKKQIANQHEKIANIRKDYQHKITKELIRGYDVIYVEKLNIKGMLEAKSFEVKNSNITDASWGNFVAILKYKAENADSLIIEVNPKNTSKMCSCCKKINKLALKDRIYKCEACGFEMDRDRNAAINIKRAGTVIMMAAKPPF